MRDFSVHIYFFKSFVCDFFPSQHINGEFRWRIFMFLFRKKGEKKDRYSRRALDPRVCGYPLNNDETFCIGF